MINTGVSQGQINGGAPLPTHPLLPARQALPPPLSVVLASLVILCSAPFIIINSRQGTAQVGLEDQPGLQPLAGSDLLTPRALPSSAGHLFDVGARPS